MADRLPVRRETLVPRAGRRPGDSHP